VLIYPWQSIDNCTNPLGPLRQQVFACLTCNPRPANPSHPYTAAGICYACSIQCHGEHTLVELFNKRDFTCDCGTTRLPKTSPCTLRVNSETNTNGGVHSEAPDANNKYNQNFQNRFCGCECDYDPFMQKGTMFQCLGLGTTENGGCGEDWWHPGCIVGLGPDWFENTSQKGTPRKANNEGFLESITDVAEAVVDESNGDAPATVNGPGPPAATEPGAEEDKDEDEDPPLPPGFPHEDDFEGFICYKCVEAHPWIKRFASAPGFLGPVFRRSAAPSPDNGLLDKTEELITSHLSSSKKRKADDDADSVTSSASKRVKESTNIAEVNGTTESMPLSALAETTAANTCKAKALPSAPLGQFSLFFKTDFRDHLCRCSDCFPELSKLPQLLEAEDNYEPPLSEDGEDGEGSTVGSGSIYERGESALKNVDRVRAIEGVMAYNHLKEKLRPLFQEFAGSGKALGAEDIKAYFAKLRGDNC
jgi:E3 ubiquitin-protein ligase UBR7